MWWKRVLHNHGVGPTRFDLKSRDNRRMKWTRTRLCSWFQQKLFDWSLFFALQLFGIWTSLAVNFEIPIELSIFPSNFCFIKRNKNIECWSLKLETNFEYPKKKNGKQKVVSRSMVYSTLISVSQVLGLSLRIRISNLAVQCL